VLALVAATLVKLIVRDALDILTATLVYLLVCFAVSLTLGTGPAMLAAVLAFLADAYFFASPLSSLRTGRVDEALTLVAFLVVALVGAQLVTEIRRRTLEAERLAELDRLRGSFVAAVSHDLQTPLTAIRAGLGLLETSASPHLRPEEVQLLNNARRNVDRLGLQINDLLALNQLEAGQFPLTVAPFDLRAVIADAVAVAHPLIEQKGQVLEVIVNGPLLVAGDRRHLEQAMLNLVTNAHHHTPPGTHITIGGRNTAEGVELQIADDGPGIPAEARDHIFERFYRAETATSGSGLGLAIAKAVVERHGGRVWVDSEPGRGAVFFVMLPHQAAKE
jgi:signal transduction histidine kinase